METIREGIRTNRFKTLMAVLVAFVTVMSAVAAWRASLAAGDAGNADTDGLAATINREQALAIHSLQAYAHYKAFTAYLRYSTLGDALAEDLDRETGEDAALLDRQRADAYALAEEIKGRFFPSDYLIPETGNYDVDREIGALVSDEERDNDINPDPHFRRADRLRAKSIYLVAVLVFFAAALWFYTLAESTSSMFKYGLAIAGGLCTLIGLFAMLAIEIML